MSPAETNMDGSEWTKENLQKLLAAMKTSITNQDRKCLYFQGLKVMDWENVSFPPFSPEACQEKWGEILHDIPKIRTLTELIEDAEDFISNPAQNNNQDEQLTEDADGLPSKPPYNGYHLFCKESSTAEEGISESKSSRLCAQRWRDLPKTQREMYSARCRELKREYSVKLSEYLMTLDEEKQQRIVIKHDIKMPRVIKEKKKRLSSKGKSKELGKVRSQRRKYRITQNIVSCAIKEASSRPSDSEDEDLEDSSSDKEDYLEHEEDEEEAEEDDVAFVVL